MFSHQVVSNSLQPHGPQHIRPPCPSPSPGVKENNIHELICLGLPWWLSGKESPCQAGDLGLIPGSGRSPGEVNGNPLQYSCLENSMGGGAWYAAVHGVAKSWTRLSDFTYSLTYLPTCIVSYYSLIFLVLANHFGYFLSSLNNCSCDIYHDILALSLI